LLFKNYIMKDNRLKQIMETISFMKSAILSGEEVSEELKEKIKCSHLNLESVQGDLDAFADMPI